MLCRILHGLGLALGKRCSCCNRFSKRSAQDAALGDYRRNVLRRRYIEGRVLNRHALRGNSAAVRVSHLTSVTLLDGNAFTGRGLMVDRVERRGNVERNAVLLRQNCDAIGADLVGGIAVRGDAVST